MREALIGRDLFTGCILYLGVSGSSPLSRLIRIENKNKRKENQMSNKLDILDEQLNVGDVKAITYNGGLNIRYIELLFSPTTKVQFAPSEDKKSIRLSVSDNNLQLPDLDCQLTKDTLRDFIIALKNVYSELLVESEEK